MEWKGVGRRDWKALSQQGAKPKKKGFLWEWSRSSSPNPRGLLHLHAESQKPLDAREPHRGFTCGSLLVPLKKANNQAQRVKAHGYISPPPLPPFKLDRQFGQCYESPVGSFGAVLSKEAYLRCPLHVWPTNFTQEAERRQVFCHKSKVLAQFGMVHVWASEMLGCFFSTSKGSIH